MQRRRYKGSVNVPAGTSAREQLFNFWIAYLVGSVLPLWRPLHCQRIQSFPDREDVEGVLYHRDVGNVTQGPGVGDYQGRGAKGKKHGRAGENGSHGGQGAGCTVFNSKCSESQA